MRCKEENCDGEIDEQNAISLTIGCGGCGQSDKAHHCNKCGRLYWASGNPVFYRSGEKAFFLGDSLVRKEEDHSK